MLRNMFNDIKNVDLFDSTHIENNVFIGIKATVLTGVVVKRMLKSGSIYAGVPVKYICSIVEYTKKNKHYFDYTKHMSGAEKKRFLHKKHGELDYEAK